MKHTVEERTAIGPRLRTAPETAGAQAQMVFFSGGSALHEACPAIARASSRTIHLVTTFDSGGSSAALRQAFGMPAVGDLRRRVLSLADPAEREAQALVALLDYRLSCAPERSRSALEAEYLALVEGWHPRLASLAPEDASFVRNALARVRRDPRARTLELRGANIGNHVLAGLYLEARSLAGSVELLARRARCRGLVLPITESCLHLGAELESGAVVVGQHRLTGKQAPPIASPVRRIFLCHGPDEPQPVSIDIHPAARRHLESAELICYSMGSFYSSVLVNLLPRGTARAIAQSPGRKLYVHNAGSDPEQLGRSPLDCVEILLEALRAEPDAPPPQRLLDALAVDQEQGRRLSSAARRRLRQLGIELYALPLAKPRRTTVDPLALTQLLVALAGR